MKNKGITFKIISEKNGLLFYLCILIENNIIFLNEIIKYLINENNPIACIEDINSTKVDNGYYIIIYGNLLNTNLDNLDNLDNLKEEIINSLTFFSKDKNKDNIHLQIHENYLIYDNQFPVTVKNIHITCKEIKSAFIASGDWFNRIINTFAYSIPGDYDKAIGFAIGNAGMDVGMIIAREIIILYSKAENLIKTHLDSNSLIDIENNNLQLLIIQIMKSYGYADINKISNLICNNKIVGYSFEVNSNVFLYNKKCDERKYIVEKFNSVFKRRNCFFFRDILKGMVEYINENINEIEFIPPESQYFACEYEIFMGNKNLFQNENLSLIEHKFSMDEDGQLIIDTEKYKITRIDTCSSLSPTRSSCQFYVFYRPFLIG